MVLEDAPRPTSKHGLAVVALNLRAAATRGGCLCRHALVPYCRRWGSKPTRRRRRHAGDKWGILHSTTTTCRQYSLLMTQLEDLGSLCVSTGYPPSGMRPVRLGAGRGARGWKGGAWARAPGVARVLFLGFFFSTRSAISPERKNRPFFRKKQA
jgi:hypothetical protein